MEIGDIAGGTVSVRLGKKHFFVLLLLKTFFFPVDRDGGELQNTKSPLDTLEGGITKQFDDNYRAEFSLKVLNKKKFCVKKG
jgi:hypothetical protein